MKLYSKLVSLLLSLGAVTGQTLPLGPQPLPTVETTSTGGQSPTVTAEMKWDGVSGRTYFVQKSSDFKSWSYVIMGTPETPIYHFTGAGAELTFSIPSPGDGNHYRLAYIDVPNYDVMTADSDNDGITDQDEIDSGGDALNGAIYPIGGVSPLELTMVQTYDWDLGAKAWEVKWRNSGEYTYFFQKSRDLENWSSTSIYVHGGFGIETVPISATLAGYHFRVATIPFSVFYNPVTSDSDGDGFPDQIEFDEESDHLDADDIPQVPSPPTPTPLPPNTPPPLESDKYYEMERTSAIVIGVGDEPTTIGSYRDPANQDGKALEVDDGKNDLNLKQWYHRLSPHNLSVINGENLKWQNSLGVVGGPDQSGQAATSIPLEVHKDSYYTFKDHQVRLKFPNGVPENTYLIKKKFVEIAEMPSQTDGPAEYRVGETRTLNFRINQSPTSTLTYSQSDFVFGPSEEILDQFPNNSPGSEPVRIALLPVDIQVSKGNEDPPEDGLVVQNDDWVRYRLFGKGVPDEPLLLEDKIQWHWRILKWDGTYDVWKPFQDGQGHTFTANPKDSGIYEVKATVDGQDFFFVRKKDDPHSAKKKGENDCFGVVDKQWQINVRNEAKKNLGSKAYAKAVANPPFKAGSWKCNQFVGDKATDGGATVPRINGRNPFRRHYPLANQWSGTEPKNIPDWTLLGRETYPQPGWVIARGVAGGTGHTGIIGYDGAWINAGVTEVNRKADLRNAKYQPARFRKYTP